MSATPTETSRPPRALGGLVRHSAIYGAVPLFRQLVSIGMTRFYADWLGAAGFGVKEIVDLWMVGLQQLLGQNALGAMVRFYYDRHAPEERARVVTSTTIVIGILAWAACGLALLVHRPLTPLMLGSGGTVGGGELETIVALVLLLIPFQLTSLSGFYYLQIQKRSGLFSTLQTAKLLFEVGMNVWLIGGLGLGVRGFLLGMLAGEALATLGLTGWMLWRLRPRVDWRVLRPIAIYALPLIPVGLCQFGLHQIDRRILLALVPGDAQAVTGVYGLGYKIGYLVNAMMLGSFLQIWQPWIYAVEDEEERAHLVARVSSYAVLAIAAATMGVVLLGRQAAMVLAGDPAFWEAWRVIPFVAAGYVFWALYQVSQIPLFIAKRTLRLFAINLAALALNVGLNLLLVPRMGFVGAGVATLATFAALAGLGMLASRSETRVPFELGRLGGVLACVLLAGGAALRLDAADAAGALAPAGAVLLKLAVWAALLAVAWRLLLRADERADLCRWLSALRPG
jgi:O-antigen/teichoic acid export membrane protein